MTDARRAGLILALSALAVVSFLAARDALRATPAPIARAAVGAAQPVRDDPSMAHALDERRLAFPLLGYDRARLRDTFDEKRGKRRHEALDIMAPRGTRVVAVADGSVAKLYRGPLAGISVYQYDAAQKHVYFYAHLDGYAPGLTEGGHVKRGDLLGFVGSTGNAPERAPHLHFAIFELGAERKWWKGRAVNPYPHLK